MNENKMSKNVGVYIHIPFCAKKCNYCDFISFQDKEEYIEKYIYALKQEIILGSSYPANLNKKQYIIKTIYIGGGTPSFINSKYIREILSTIRENWKVKEDCEITIEVNPGTVDKQKLETYYNSGINRLSIGLQSSIDEELKILGRIHTYEKFLDTYKLSEDIGFKNINVDIMLGLPEQTVSSLNKTVNRILELKPKHISIYSLILEEDTQLYKYIEHDKYTLPNENIEREMYWSVKNRLEEVGYTHYEISNYAIKGYESKHNLDCWNQEEYIGFGLAAHSYLNERRLSNTENVNEYIDNIGEDGFVCSDKMVKTIHEVQNKESKMKEYMILGLRKIEGVKISQFKDRFVDNPLYLYREELNKLVGRDLIEIDIDSIKLTNKGIDLANIVWEEFV